jgi:glutathione S-transferase
MSQNSGKTHGKSLMRGAPGSLWSGKTRSYLIKKGIDYQEIYASQPRFKDEILPCLGYFVIPVVELKDGTLIQDTTDTILHFGDTVPEPPLIPSTPLQKAAAWVIGFFGSEMFLISAMHYRWNFPEQQGFLDAMFGRILSPHRDMDKQREDIAPAMEFFSGFLPDLGVTDESIPAIERSHKEFLEVLNAHFLQHPYLLGGRPCIADFGLIGPLCAHLGRDPVPATLLKNLAPHVYRWTERMFEAGFTDGEFPDVAPDYMQDDALPETLLPVLEYLFRDCGPQALGMIETYNGWVAANPDLPAGTPIQSEPQAAPGAHPLLGHYEFQLRSTTVRRRAFADAPYHFQRLLDVIADLDSDSRAKFDGLIKSVGGAALMAARLARPIKSENYRFLLT